MQTKITFLPDDRARISIEGLHGTNPAACIAWRDFATRGEAEGACARAHRLGVGLEQRGSDCRLKLYVEYSLSRPQGRLMPGQGPGIALMIESWKSPLLPRDDWTRTDYWRLSGWSAGQLIDWLGRESQTNVQGPWLGLDLLTRMAAANLRRSPGGALDVAPRLVRAIDQDGHRQGLGLRLYDSGLNLSDCLRLTNAQPALVRQITQLVAHDEDLLRSEVAWCHVGKVAASCPYLIFYIPLDVSDLQSTLQHMLTRASADAPLKIGRAHV